MHNIYLPKENGYTKPFESGYITLTGITGNHYRNLALNIPGYGWVPCSRKLQKEFSKDPEKLVLVVSDPDDINPPYTSSIWVSRTDIQYESVDLW